MIDAPALGRTITAPVSKAVSIAHAVTIAAAFLFQAVGLYATLATFGGWITLVLYGAGALAVVVPHVLVRRRAASC